ADRALHRRRDRRSIQISRIRPATARRTSARKMAQSSAFMPPGLLAALTRRARYCERGAPSGGTGQRAETMEGATQTNGASRWARVRGSRTRQEWARVGGMAAVIIGLTALGFFILLALVVPKEYSLGKSGVLGVGVGVTAYTLGLRHAFDADHIAAIDNTTRKL